MSDDIRPDQDTEPGLRRSDTRPLPFGLPFETPAEASAPSRGRHRRDMPTLAQIALWGVPVGGLALIVGWTAPGLLGGDEARPAPPAVSSPSEEAGPVAVPSLTLPSPTASRADRSRSRTATPSPTKTSASPSPSTSSPSPSPSPEPTPSRSLTPPSKPAPTTPTDDPQKPPPGDEGGGNDDDNGEDDGGQGGGTGSGGAEGQGYQP